MLLFLIAFAAGVLTVLAPCILPLIPVIVGGSVSGGVDRKRALTIAVSLGVSVILFTLILKFSTAFIGIPQYAWQWFSGGILTVFGLLLLFPRLWESIGLVNTLNRESNQFLGRSWMHNTFWGDVSVGLALGPVFSTCSPTYFVILATVLPASFLVGMLDLLAYTFGLVLMLLAVSLVGQKVVDRLGVAADPRGWFRRTIGALFIIIGILIFSGLEQRIERWLSQHVYDVTKLEQALLQLQGQEGPMPNLGQVMSGTATSSLSVAQKAMYFAPAPELAGIEGYLNTGGQPITIGQFKGDKVVLIDFWTYSCINCERTLPYLKGWDDAYRDQGLQIIGVHTPEFAFERVPENVERAIASFGLKYPSALDNSYATWRAFGNNYWPRKYLIDIDGYIVYDHIGEGGYEETEMAIQTALRERAERLGGSGPGVEMASPVGAESADFSQVGSPEIYFGSARNDAFGSGSPGVSGKQTFAEPKEFRRNVLYFTGRWDITPQYAETAQSAGNNAFYFKYLARGMYMVAGSAAGTEIRVEVLRDGVPLEEGYAGKDIVFEGGKSYLLVKDNRLYKIIEDSTYGEHLMEFVVPEGGLQVYTYTFG